MDYIIWFHDYLLYWITAITAFVLALLIIVIVRFNARANPIPSRTTHNTLVEVPVDGRSDLDPAVDRGALVQAAVPPAQRFPPVDLTVKATGKQWYWSYSYPDHGKFEFDSLMLKEGERKPEPAAPACGRQ